MSHKCKASPAKAIHQEMISGRHRSHVEMALNHHILGADTPVFRYGEEALRKYPHQIAQTVKALRKWGYKLEKMVFEETRQQLFSDADLDEISDKIGLVLLCRGKDGFYKHHYPQG